VEGTFGTLTKDFINEDIIVDWYDDNRGENAAVMFSYKPQSSLPGIGASASTLLVSNSLKGFLTNLEHEHNFPVYAKRSERIMLAMDEDTDTATDSPKNFFAQEPDNGFFVYPYYLRMEDSGIGFDADQYGLMFGLEHKFDEQYVVGLIGGVGQESIKYNTGSGDDKDKPEIYSLGGYLNYSPKPWFFEAALLGYMADHDYEGKTGYNYEIREDAGYWSNGLESELKAGYIFESEDLTITPEAGLNYSYWNVENFRTSATDSSWNRYYHGADEDSLTAIAGISGLKTAKLDDSTKYDLLLGFHVEQSLKGNSISMDQSIPGLGSDIVSVKQDIGDTTFVGNIAANFTLKDNKFINLSFRNAINADYRSYAAKLSVGFKF
jgi:outer membrane autotransporter protein